MAFLHRWLLLLLPRVGVWIPARGWVTVACVMGSVAGPPWVWSREAACLGLLSTLVLMASSAY